MNLPIVEVTWLDACIRTSSKPLSTAADSTELAERRTVGYLVSRTRKKLVLAMTFDRKEDDEQEASVDDRYVIPARWVKNVRRLQ